MSISTTLGSMSISQYQSKNSRSQSSQGFLRDSPCSCGHSSVRRYGLPPTIPNAPVRSLEFGKVLVSEMWILRLPEEPQSKSIKMFGKLS
jgi:hypothetical protein